VYFYQNLSGPTYSKHLPKLFLTTLIVVDPMEKL